MEDKNIVFIYMALAAAITGLGIWIVRRSKEKRKLILEEIRLICGGEPALMTRCGVIQGASRVPGILALCNERLVFRSYIMNFNGEIPLSCMEKVEVKRSLSYKYARKKIVLGMRVLEITAGGETRYFFIQKTDVEEWQKALAGLKCSC